MKIRHVSIQLVLTEQMKDEDLYPVAKELKSALETTKHGIVVQRINIGLEEDSTV